MLKKIGFLLVVLFMQTLFTIGILALWYVIPISDASVYAGKSSLTDFFIPLLHFGVFVFALPLASAIWSYFNTRQLMNKDVDTLLPPVGWFFVNLFFWYPGLTIYIFLRKFSFQTNSGKVSA